MQRVPRLGMPVRLRSRSRTSSEAEVSHWPPNSLPGFPPRGDHAARPVVGREAMKGTTMSCKRRVALLLVGSGVALGAVGGGSSEARAQGGAAGPFGYIPTTGQGRQTQSGF